MIIEKDLHFSFPQYQKQMVVLQNWHQLSPPVSEVQQLDRDFAENEELNKSDPDI